MLIRFALIVVLMFAGVAAGSADDVTIDSDVVYGHKDGLALTFDVLQPSEPNGAAIVWIQSGGWYSGWQPPEAFRTAGNMYLERGYTLIVLRHGSAPKYAVPDAVADVRRAIRVIRSRADELGIDADRIGATGGSAGGHLTLMLATTGDDGDSKSNDPILRQSSRIRVAVAIFPPTDISTWVENPPEEIARIPALKPPLTFDPQLAPELSPLLKATEQTAPTLMIHGDEDLLVPIEHSIKMHAALEELGVDAKLVTVEGAGHGFTPQQNREIVRPAILDWFDTHLGVK